MKSIQMSAAAKNVYRSLLFLFMLFASILVLESTVYAYDLEISRLEVDIEVSEDNTYLINENIDVTFYNRNMHGIFREIPAKTYFGKPVKITQISVPGHEKQITREGDYLSIKIGDPNRFALPEEHYLIQYKYAIGDDLNTDMDEFYFNIVGTEWQIPIDQTIFRIQMPKDFDASRIHFTSGYLGSSQTASVEYTIEGNVISGKLDHTLQPGEALTIALPLDEGFYSQVKPDGQFIAWFSQSYVFLFPVLFFLALGLWIKYGRNDPIYPTVEFYPPEGLTPAEIGYIYDGQIDPYDLTAMLVYWASKGYLRIIEEEEQVGILFKKTKNRFKLQKVKSLPERANAFEKVYFNGLFDIYAIDGVVDIRDLKDTFYNTLNKVKKQLTESFINRSIYTRQGQLTLVAITAIGFLLFFLVFAKVFNEINPYSTGLVIAFSLIGALFLGSFLAWSAYLFKQVKKRLPRDRIKLVLNALGASVISLLIVVGLLSIYETNGLSWVGMALGVILVFWAPYADKRTERGTDWLAHLVGLKTFIKTAERDRIEMLINENPGYFYDVLPYAMVLGVTDQWAKNFEDIALGRPEWYDSRNAAHVFSASYFVSHINTQMQATGKTMASSPASSGGGSSGGGSSGGGSGGGGGGGW